MFVRVRILEIVKTALVCIVLLIGCAIGWTYQYHADVFQDAMADFNHDPNGVRAELEQTQKQCADLSAANASLQSEISTLKDNSKSLSDQIAQLKAAPPPPAPAPAAPPPPVVTLKPFIPPSPLPAQPNWTWTATDGKTYKNVVITKVEADCVTIIDDEGGARLYIVTLPPDIQKLLNYDPDQAKVAGEARVKQEISDQAALADEKQRVQQQRRAEAATDQKNTAPAISDLDRQLMQQQISDLQSGIRRKLREIAQNFANDGYSRNSSHSAYEDSITKDAEQVSALQVKLGLPATALPAYYPYYPYYYYYLP